MLWWCPGILLLSRQLYMLLFFSVWRIRSDRVVHTKLWTSAIFNLFLLWSVMVLVIMWQENDVNYDHRFQRTDQWLPVYTWLESIKDTEEVVTSKDVLDWLSANPAVRDDLQSKHSRGHLMHYIKQCHLKILKRRKVLVDFNCTITF